MAMVIRTRLGRPAISPFPIAPKSPFCTGTVVPLANKNATPLVTPYIPRVPIKGGTRRSAISNPLITPGTTEIPKPAKTASTRLRNGFPNWVPQLKTWAVTTAERPMVNPTDKSIPPEMMTKVWPRPSKSGVTVKTAMDLTLKGLKKNVLSYSTCAQISKVIKRIPRKSQARNAAKKSSQRIFFVTSETVAVVVTRNVRKRRGPGQKEIWPRKKAAARFHSSGEKLIRIDEPFHFGVIDVVFVNDGESGSDQGRNRLAGQMGIGRNDPEITDFGRMLSDGNINIPRLDLAYHGSGCIKCHHFHLPGHPALLDAVGRTHGRKQIRAKDTG